MDRSYLKTVQPDVLANCTGFPSRDEMNDTSGDLDPSRMNDPAFGAMDESFWSPIRSLRPKLVEVCHCSEH